MMTHSISILIVLLTVNIAQAIEPLEVAPQSIWSKPSQVHQFRVTGGVPPIYWQSRSGEVSVDEENPNIFIYKAPRRYMQDNIHFFDRAGQEIQVTIDILRPFRVSPSRRHIPINGTTKFRLYGGSGQWQLKSEQPTDEQILTATQTDNHTLTIQASATAGTQTIRLYDQITDEEVEVQVQVYAPLKGVRDF
jgi:hypothetical protein